MRNIFLLVILFFTVVSPSKAQRIDVFKIKTVVIDPGHGGNDPGAVFGKVYEKDINLDVALILGQRIKKEFPHIKVVYTRSKDVFVSLIDRGKIANKNDGDLFISIHVNSTAAKETAARGTETFTMGLHKSDASMEVARKENSVIILEEGYEKKYQGFDPKDPESYIMFGLGQYSFSMSSIMFANMVEQQYQKHCKSPSRGVKQAGMLVLWYSSMPSILTELGFLNNSEDRKRLTSKEGQVAAANALYTAFKEYKERIEVESHYTPAKNSNPFKVNINGYTSGIQGYAVQLYASRYRAPIDEEIFGYLSPYVVELKDGDIYKYTVGIMENYKDATKVRDDIRKDSKYKDCYVVGINRGVAVNASIVRNLIKK